MEPRDKNYTDITILIDKSGSMCSMRDAVVDGLNTFIGEMKKTPGDTRWTFMAFDDPASAGGAKESFPQTIFEDQSEHEIRLLEKEDYQPRGSTALVDAVCMAMRKTSARTSGQDYVQKAMMIVTDGLENASREFTSDKMREMIARRESQGWKFMYLGANQDSFATAKQYNMNTSMQGYGLAADATNAFDYASTPDGMFQAIASGCVGMCSLVSGSLVSGSVSIGYTT